MKRDLVGRCLLLALTAGVAATAISASAASSPKSLYTAALAAMRSEQSVHYVASSTQGNVQVDYVGDVGRTQGTQRITIRIGGHQGSLTVVVSGHHAWVRGDAFALNEFLAFPTSVATKDANVWVVVPALDYTSVAADVTLGSAADTLRLSGPLTSAPPTKMEGIAVLGVSGTSIESPKSAATLYVSAAGKPLPVAQVGAGQRVVYTRWNEALKVTIPAHPVRVTGGATPTGPAVPA